MQQHLIAVARDRFWLIRLSSATTRYAKHAKNAKNGKNAKNAKNAKSARSIECFRDCPEQKGGGDPPPGGFQYFPLPPWGQLKKCPVGFSRVQ